MASNVGQPYSPKDKYTCIIIHSHNDISVSRVIHCTLKEVWSKMPDKSNSTNIPDFIQLIPNILDFIV